jgi:hypothetical protein
MDGSTRTCDYRRASVLHPEPLTRTEHMAAKKKAKKAKKAKKTKKGK